jgi:hypothetical protein
MKIDYRKAYTSVLIYDNCLIKLFIQIESINAVIDSQIIFGVQKLEYNGPLPIMHLFFVIFSMILK